MASHLETWSHLSFVEIDGKTLAAAYWDLREKPSILGSTALYRHCGIDRLRLLVISATLERT